MPDAPKFLVECFDLLGRCMSGSMGRAPLTWSEVKSFSDQSGYMLSGWESEQLINMSREYCYMAHDADEIDCPAPYRSDIKDDNDALQRMRENVDKQLDQFFL